MITDFTWTCASFLSPLEIFQETHPGQASPAVDCSHIVRQHGEPLEDTTFPTTARRWHEESRKWIEQERATRGQYQGRAGDNVARCISRWGGILAEIGHPVTPKGLRPEDLMALLPYLGTAPKTKRVFLGWLGSFLASRGNRVVQESGIARNFETLSTSGRKRWLSETQLGAVMNAAQGTERLVVALEGFQGLRRIEVMRARLEDIRLDTTPPTMGVRGKAHRDTISRVVPLASRVLQELGTYLPTRARWASECTDCPYLLVYMAKGALHPYVAGTPLDRMVSRAGKRAGVQVSNHDLRRTFGRVLRNRGANLLEIRDLYGHSSVEMTESYIGSQQDKMAQAIRLLDSAPKTPETS